MNDALLLYENENPEKIINGYCPISSKEDFISTSVPKVVFAPNGRLLYMSRSCIPGNKSGDFDFGYRQVCVYGFPRKDLRRFAEQQEKTPLEQEEDIEILYKALTGKDLEN